MKTLFTMLAAAGLLSALAFAGRDFAVADLPANVKAAIEQHYPGAKLIKAEEERKAAGVLYEVKIEHNHHQRDLDIQADGKIVKDELDDD